MKSLIITIKRNNNTEEIINIGLQNEGVLNCTVYHKNVRNSDIVNLLTMGALDTNAGNDLTWRERIINIGDIIEIRLSDNYICDDPDEIRKVYESESQPSHSIDTGEQKS